MKNKAKYCGEFYDNATETARLIGYIYKIGSHFVIRGKEEFSGKVLWESAPFNGNEFRRFRTLNLGYAVANYYTSR